MQYKAVPWDVNWENIVKIAKDFNVVYNSFLQADKERDLEVFEDFIVANLDLGTFDKMLPGSRDSAESLVNIKGNKVTLEEWGSNPFSPRSPFRTWIHENFPTEQDIERFLSLRAYSAALKNLGNLTFGLMDIKKVKRAFHGLVETMKDLTSDTSDLLKDVYPEHFSYKGFQISNPDRLSKYNVNNMLEGIEALTEVFKKRSMTRALQVGIKRVVFRFARTYDGSAAATYEHKNREITLLQWSLNPKTEGHYDNWIVETFIHEFGHYIHIDYLSKDAQSVWDSGWTKVEEAKYKEMIDNRPVIVSREDKSKYYDILMSVNFDFKAVGSRHLKAEELDKYMKWLALSHIDISYDPNAVVLTSKAKKIRQFFKPTKKAWKDTWKEDHKSDPMYSEDLLEQEAERYYENYRRNYLESINLAGSEFYNFDMLPKVNNTEASDDALHALGLPTPYAGKNLKEDFAETFVMYLLKPERLSKIARYRMERALSLSGLYGKPVMQLAKAKIVQVSVNLVLAGHADMALGILRHFRKVD